MKFITVKSKETTVSVDLVPPLVLGDKQRVSLVDIRIPEQYFEFTKDQAIGDDGRYKNHAGHACLQMWHGYAVSAVQRILNLIVLATQFSKKWRRVYLLNSKKWLTK